MSGSLLSGDEVGMIVTGGWFGGADGVSEAGGVVVCDRKGKVFSSKLT